MVKVKELNYIDAEGHVNLDAWLTHIRSKSHLKNTTNIEAASQLAAVAGEDCSTDVNENCLQQGLAIAEILAELDMDQTTLAASIVYPCARHADLTIDDIREQLGDDIAKMVHGILRMQTISEFHRDKEQRNQQQLDNLRKMLLAIVDDVRIVVIKLAERTRVLRRVAKMEDTIRKKIATDVMDIYAPLANRLGIGQLKWEMEDFAFRYLENTTYKEIASGLKSRRLERDEFINKVVSDLNDYISQAKVSHAEVYGRSKHIYSIYKKMQRKKVNVEEVYDTLAVRVLVDSVEDCYTTLSLIHEHWQPIPEEFDDYINNPKPNGYRSLHTAVISEEGRHFEVQIRTRTMHEEAELGVAAHWRYKESDQGSTPADKIDWLRQVLAWQQDVARGHANQEAVVEEFLEKRVYVFTPQGDIVDLAKGATPLDFAYHIHSEVGHRCKGAKIGGKIVPLTHELETGDSIEILTQKNGKPSRDWLSPEKGYLKTPRARAKVHHWFKLENFTANKAKGTELLEREAKKAHIKVQNLDQLTKKFNVKNPDDLLAVIGSGEVKPTHVITALKELSGEVDTTKEDDSVAIVFKQPSTPTSKRSSGVNIQGMGNLLTHTAGCCRPVPGDTIIGFITQGRGVSIHRKDCHNLSHLVKQQENRLVEVSWGDADQSSYPVELYVTAHDRPGLVRDVSQLITSEKFNLIGFNTHTDNKAQRAFISATLHITDRNQLDGLIDKIKSIENVIEVKRQ